jgi:molybdopterin-guanine dinucleotide biosynthesis protein A
METSNGFTGFILAGGRSRRMGSNKALLPLGGRRLVDWAIDLLEPHVQETFVVGPPEVFPLLHVPVRPDEIRQAGPLGGILTGLRHSRFDSCLVLGVDLPFLSGEILDRILAACRGYDLTLPRIGETCEPLCAVYSKSCVTHIEALLMAGRKSVQELMSRVRVNALPEEDFREFGGASAFFNINTREDYEQAKRRVAQLHHPPQDVRHG